MMDMIDTVTTTAESQNRSMRSYYRLHAAVYDVTRWAFLFGRKRLVDQLPFDREAHFTLLEVGCGTGYNLVRLGKQFPNARLIGVDISADMLRRATRQTTSYSQRVFLFEKPYVSGSFQLKMQPDVVLCSYALTMFNPGWEEAIERAWQDLPPGGLIAVVDFHRTPSGWFRWWMGQNHVRMDGHLLPVLKDKFETVTEEVHAAGGGLWQYFLFVGRKK
jgi:S-adenosylmethionine-diacylgycerolhomoserine-N-methlytransferase